MASNPISQSNQFEFNDSVLTTKAWNSSRYDGRQLSATTVNRFTVGDSTYGKTPVIQNYSRNIYIGNDIVGMNSSDGEAEDNSLLQFDNFSYAQTNQYITVNDDDSITFNSLGEVVEDDYKEIIGFYQSFYDDFKEGTNCRIILNDNFKKSKLSPSYPIYFNGGQIQKILRITPGGPNSASAHIGYATSSNNIRYNQPLAETPEVSGFEGLIYNELLLNEFYTGSLSSTASLTPLAAAYQGFPLAGGAGLGAYVLIPGEDLATDKLKDLFDASEAYRDNSTYKGDKRFFFTFTISGSEAPIRTVTSGSIIPTPIKSINLAELSTGEFKSHDTNTNKISFTSSSALHQNYVSFVPAVDSDGLSDHVMNTGPTPPVHVTGSLIFSKVNDSTPSLLLPLNKALQLPDALGDKGFIILPHNIHPYIKDNLAYFLTQAGINVGGDTSTVIKINPRNRLLK